MLAANAPDIDIISALDGEYTSLAFRRGWTHGPLAVLALPFLVAGCVLLWDRVFRRCQQESGPPTRPGAVLLLALIGVASHPLLDWLNTYGIRLLMPFSGQWFYGDAVFIIDPWVWLLLGGGLYLAGPHNRARTARWLALAALCSLAVLLAPPVPFLARVVWVAGLLVIAAAQSRLRERAGHAVARFTGACATVYVLMLVVASVVGERLARATAESAGVRNILEVLYAPLPANPLAAQIIVATEADYRYGELYWLRGPRVHIDAVGQRRGDWSQSEVQRALRLPEVRDYLVWARFPFVRTEPAPGGTAVIIGDARYPAGTGAGGLEGLRVVLQDGTAADESH